MNYKSKDSILNFIKLLVIIDITIFILSGLICWFANLRTLNQYINTLFWVGSSTIVIGVIIVFGDLLGTRNFTYKYSQSVQSDDIHDRTNQQIKDSGKNYHLLILFSVAGIIPVIIGYLVTYIR